jgi:hypothetical protein
LSRVKLWKGDPTQRLTVILPAGLAVEMKIESLKRGVDVSVLAAQAFAVYLNPGSLPPGTAAPVPPRPEPPERTLIRHAEAVRRGQELVAMLRAAFASGEVTLAEFSRHLAQATGHPNPVGLSSAVRQWKRVPDIHQRPVEKLLIQLGLAPHSRSDAPAASAGRHPTRRPKK